MARVPIWSLFTGGLRPFKVKKKKSNESILISTDVSPYSFNFKARPRDNTT